jgi:glycosyltransferase involved in cell wall biosynthesis
VSTLAGFDLVHTVETCHGFSDQALTAKQRFGCRVVVTVWENLPFNRKGYSRYAFRQIRPRVLAGADAFLAVTERAREALILEGVDPGRIRVIPMGVDLERFRPARPVAGWRQSLGLPDDAAVLLSVGTMSAAKGLPFLLQAIKRACLDSELHGIRFALVLVGRDLGMARTMVGQMGLERVVHIVGYVPYDDMPALYNLAAIHVLPSVPTPTWQEQFGMVLVESLASGTPVLSTTSGSIAEIVGEAGVLVPPANHVILYRELKHLLLDPARRQELSRLGRRRAELLFDRSVVAKQIGDLYASLL